MHSDYSDFHISIFRQSYILKTAGHERNGRKCGPQLVISVYRTVLTVKVARSV